MYALVGISVFLGLALAAPTQNDNTITTSTIVTNPTTVSHASPTTTSTTPSSTKCSILIENTPWLLTNITHFTPSFPSQNHTTNSTTTTTASSSSSLTNSSSSSKSSGFISFHFHDTNKGLELETRCFRTLPPRDRHSSREVDNKPGGGTYYPCEDGRVRFAFTAAGEGEGTKGVLKVGRGHRDDW
ncbi:hypothetical protein D0863_12954 [Hortaea werneckii]|uniref:AA1-like domain-containing protein n=1 Tax=Hortaea werneckii TaxID=91943 RepID=A0A3M7CWV9_HORWE|nr:hypothetical protein D0863_12954 [Hortaea werneckii]